MKREPARVAPRQVAAEMAAEIASMHAVHVEALARLLPEPGSELERLNRARAKAESLNRKPATWGTALKTLAAAVAVCPALNGIDRRNLRMIAEGYFLGLTLQDRLPAVDVEVLTEPWARHALVWARYPRRSS